MTFKINIKYENGMTIDLIRNFKRWQDAKAFVTKQNTLYWKTYRTQFDRLKIEDITDKGDN